ncbi:CPBP family intramembrane metalloprotease [Brevibacterium sp. RIT803]|nr:CPBP family intramembrane metalloprotease [Brevibacterium sp. RIT 803]
MATDPVDTSAREPAGDVVEAKGRPLAIVPATVPWLEFAVFVAVAVILAWLVCLPLWLSGEGLGDPVLVQVSGMAMMFTPLIAVVVAMIVQRRRAGEPRASIVRYLGIWPLRPFGRVLGMTALAFFGIFVLVAAAYLVGAAFGWMQVDLLGLSGFKTQLSHLPGLDEVPVALAVIGYLLIMALGSALNVIVAFGEEVGWRGWLLTSLRPLGTWPALLIVGVIWGLWHAPLILLGYNFARPDITGVAFMVGGCIMLGILFGWLRLRTGSVWPAVAAHAALNGSAGMLLGLFIDGSASTPDMALVSFLGVSGWIVSAIVIAILFATGQFSKQPELGVKLPKAPAPVAPPAPAVPPASSAQPMAPAEPAPPVTPHGEAH